jgi:K+-transporting ATPase ATPase A chain
MSLILWQDAFYLAAIIGLSIPLGLYIHQVMAGERVFLSHLLGPVEKGIYKAMGISSDEQMSARKYSLSVMVFSLICLVFLWLLLMLQGVLPGNPQGMGPLSWHLAFNTAASFVSNTNWQAYSGETSLSYLSQFLGLAVQNFVSAAAGIAVLYALIRGFIYKQKDTLGSFWPPLHGRGTENCDARRPPLESLWNPSTASRSPSRSQGEAWSD